MWCWGINSDGELGDGTTETRDAPVRVAGLPPASAIDLDSGASCALTRDDDVWCWGRGHALTPKRLAHMEKATALAVGFERVCTLDEAGAVTCDGWAKGRHELGATALAASGMNTCTLAGDVMTCWGTLDAPDYDPEPKPLLDRKDVVAMTVTDDGFCAPLRQRRRPVPRPVGSIV